MNELQTMSPVLFVTLFAVVALSSVFTTGVIIYLSTRSQNNARRQQTAAIEAQSLVLREYAEKELAALTEGLKNGGLQPNNNNGEDEAEMGTVGGSSVNLRTAKPAGKIPS
jgi:hypothetical protein